MKISFMLKREDFYTINQKTLGNYYKNSEKEKKLYIYPELNAIVTARPSKTVRQYLYTEYRVNGSFLKRLLVRLYATVMLGSLGLFAARSIKIKTDADKNTLIYPCNKKYRVFDFTKNQVSVLGKDGFPTDDLQREMQFRTSHTADFIPGLLYSDETGYIETIIDGCPVARTGACMNDLCDRAVAIWNDYIRPYTRQLSGVEYAQQLTETMQQLQRKAEELGKQLDVAAFWQVAEKLLIVLRNAEEMIPVSLSHGDLQPGNIWVENGTDKIYIIDWESWRNRSTWYDLAVLYEGLRRNDGIAAYAQKQDLTHATVLLEDIIFRLTELITLPYDYGCKEFDAYIKVLEGGIADV